MRLRHIFLFLALICVLTACKKNEFNLDFNLAENISENYDVIYYATDKEGGLTIQAMASVMKGRCQLKGVTRLPTLLYISSRKSKLPLVVYAEKGDLISITGDNDAPFSWKVEGNKINEELSNWREQNSEKLLKAQPSEVNNAIKDFIEENPSDVISLILLLCYYDRNENEKEYAMLLNRLSEVSEKDEWISMSARADQLTLTASSPARIETMIMRSFQGGSDTISFNGDFPGFILFWQSDAKNRSELIDSLKVVLKEYPDSSKRIIADINLDSDSIIWRNSLRRDSVKNILRLWAPAGLADEALAKLKVNSIPFYIVFDKQGTQAYRGSDFSEARKSFRIVAGDKVPAQKTDSVAGDKKAGND